MTYIIAEAASAHDGDVEKARRLIEIAAAGGAQAVKFQFWSDADKLADRRDSDLMARETYRRYQLPEPWLAYLACVAASVKLDFICSTFLPEDVAVVAPFVQRFKVATPESTYRALLQAHEGVGRPVYVSVEPGAEAESQRAAEGLSAAFEWLHCIPRYPAPLDALALRTLQAGRTGFSDHSGQRETGGVAVAAGAQVLEVHIQAPDTERSNPDAGPFALLPEAFAAYVSFVRQVEGMLGAHAAAVDARAFVSAALAQTAPEWLPATATFRERQAGTKRVMRNLDYVCDRDLPCYWPAGVTPTYYRLPLYPGGPEIPVADAAAATSSGWLAG